MKKRSVLTLLISILLVIICGCTEDYRDSVGNGGKTGYPVADHLPVIQGTHFELLTPSEGIAGFNISDNGGAAIIVQGICWSTEKFPTTVNSKVEKFSSCSEKYVYHIQKLSPNAKYFLRAFATNDLGTAYGEQILLNTNDLAFNSVEDIDGNVYTTIQIGDQTWMGENLKTTRYNDGKPISYGEGGAAGNTRWFESGCGAYCWYDNNQTVYREHGAIYNWYSVESDNLCPAGWYVPTIVEWNTMVTFLGGIVDTLGPLKERVINWDCPDDNIFKSVFGQVPGAGLDVWGFNYGGSWWTADPGKSVNGSVIWANVVSYTEESLQPKSIGFNVRCLKSN